MDECAACRHIRALHLGRAGACQLNGCRCGGFELAPQPPEPELEQLQAVESTFGSFQTILVGAIAFVAGVVVGCQL